MTSNAEAHDEDRLAELAERRAWARQVADALASLPTEQRIVLQLAYGRRCSQPHIAATLRVPEPDVRRLAAAGLARLAS